MSSSAQPSGVPTLNALLEIRRVLVAGHAMRLEAENGATLEVTVEDIDEMIEDLRDLWCMCAVCACVRCLCAFVVLWCVFGVGTSSASASSWVDRVDELLAPDPESAFLHFCVLVFVYMCVYVFCLSVCCAVRVWCRYHTGRC